MRSLLSPARRRLIRLARRSTTATGGVGCHLVTQARAVGPDIVAVVRDPSRLDVDVPAVRVDLADGGPVTHEALIGALRGRDAVFSALGAHST